MGWNPGYLLKPSLLYKIMLLKLTYYFLITLLVVNQHHHYVNMTQKNVQAPIDMESDVSKKKSDSLLKKPIC